MRYRLYFKDNEPVEVTAFDFKLRTPRSIMTWPHGSEGRGPTVDIAFCSAIVRIADDHDRTVYDDIREAMPEMLQEVPPGPPSPPDTTRIHRQKG